MNKLRLQKHNPSRALKSMKVVQSMRYAQVTQPPQQSILTPSRQIIYTVSKCLDANKKRTLRYGHLSTQNSALKNANFRVHRSQQLKNSYLQSNQGSLYGKHLEERDKDRGRERNPYLMNNSKTPGKQLRSYSYKARRLVPQQSAKLTFQKSLHLKNPITNVSDLGCLLERSEDLFKEQKYKECKEILQKIIQTNKTNKQILFLLCRCYYHLKDYQNCIQIGNRLIGIDSLYCKEVYFFLNQSYKKYIEQFQKQRFSPTKQREVQKNMLQNQKQRNLKIGHQNFPHYSYVIFQLAKMQEKRGSLSSAVKYYKKGVTNCQLIQEKLKFGLGLCQCYCSMKQFDNAMKFYENLRKQGTKLHDSTVKIFDLGVEKAFSNSGQYQFCSMILQRYRQMNANELPPHLEFKLAYCYYKMQNIPNCLVHIQQCLLHKQKSSSTSSLILLTLVHIKNRDFYSAHHTLLRKQHLQIEQKDIFIFQTFCEGVLSLMKKKYSQGIELILKVKQAIEQYKGGSNLQFVQEIKYIYGFYLSYGYFCLGQISTTLQLNNTLSQKCYPSTESYLQGNQYNSCLCEGLLQYEKGDLTLTKTHFQRSIELYPMKPQGFLYLGVVLLKQYLNICQKLGDKQQQKLQHNQENVLLLLEIKQTLQMCLQNLKQLNNNYAASAYYIKSCLSAYMGQWDNAINQIDEAIQRAQQNDHKFFYLRALILGCCQNFKQAIIQVSAAISICNPIDRSCGRYFLLRAKCQQIQGEGNKAFTDLQQYIALFPQDNQIHKLAGHLLFENGAFEDAIQAYENGQIKLQKQNYDVFLTKAKTYFLLGMFDQCVQQMQIANRLKEDKQVQFDIKIIKILGLFKASLAQNGQNQFQDSVGTTCESFVSEIKALLIRYKSIDYGKIFKTVELSMLMSLFHFYSKNYREAQKQFKQTIILKQKQFAETENDDEEQMDQKRQKDFFVAQMCYNRALCFLLMGDSTSACKCLFMCTLETQSKTLQKLNDLINILQTSITNEASQQKQQSKNMEIFSQKNKMSRLLDSFSISVNNEINIVCRLCIPFPKVEPPEINPQFQLSILKQINIKDIERKPEAPWIMRESNSIKFTQKIQNFSRLDINNSQLSKPAQKMKASKEEHEGSEMEMYKFQDDSDSSQSNEKESQDSVSDLRQKLRLDDGIEEKLKKILANKKKDNNN